MQVLWCAGTNVGPDRLITYRKNNGTSLCFKARLSANPIDMKMSFYSHANDTHFHKKGFSLSLVFKVRVFVTLSVKYINELIRSEYCSCLFVVVVRNGNVTRSQFNKTLTSVAIVLWSENKSYTSKLHL